MKDEYIFSGEEICHEKKKKNSTCPFNPTIYWGNKIFLNKKRIKKITQLRMGDNVEVDNGKFASVTSINGDTATAYSKDKLTSYHLEFAKDKRKCWVCTGVTIISQNLIAKGLIQP